METWREIVAEMRRFGDRHWMHGGQSCREFADRIEKSCKTLEETWRIAIQSAQARHDEKGADDYERRCGMTLRMPPWEAERVANVLEYAAMLTATEPKMKPWMNACAAKIKAAVKAEREKRRRTENRG